MISVQRFSRGVVSLLFFSTIQAQEATAQSEQPLFEWAACPFNTSEAEESRLRCSYLSVPDNRESAAGRTLRLAVAVAESTAPEAQKDPAVFLNGEPGGRSLPEWISRMRRLVGDRTAVVFDYRGAGGYWLWMCDDVHRDRASATERSLIRSDVPVLIISGELDYRTPPTKGEELEGALSQSRHFELPGLPHLPGSRSLPCIGWLIRQFLDAPEAEPDAACLTDLPEVRLATEPLNWLQPGHQQD